MLNTEETFFTTVGCMDGRIHNILVKFGKEKFDAMYPDTITEAGLVGLLSLLQSPEATADGGQAKDTADKFFLDSLKKKIQISLEIHHSKGIIVHGHEECAGNQIDDEQHKKNVLKAANLVRSMINNSVPVISVFVVRANHGWTIQEL